MEFKTPAALRGRGLEMLAGDLRPPSIFRKPDWQHGPVSCASQVVISSSPRFCQGYALSKTNDNCWPSVGQSDMPGQLAAAGEVT